MAHVDVRAHLRRISAARRAAEELRSFAASCKLASLREDSNAVADEALELLREFEANVGLAMLCLLPLQLCCAVDTLLLPRFRLLLVVARAEAATDEGAVLAQLHAPA